MHLVCNVDAEEYVNLLLKLDLNIDSQDKVKLTPLHLAILGGKEKIVLK